MFSSSSETRRWFWDRLFLAGQHLPLPALFETVQRRRSEAHNNTQNTENVPFQYIQGFSSQFNKTSGITVFRYSGKKESLLLSCCYSPLYTNLLKMTKRTKNIKLDVTSCCFDCLFVFCIDRLCRGLILTSFTFSDTLFSVLVSAIHETQHVEAERALSVQLRPRRVQTSDQRPGHPDLPAADQMHGEHPPAHDRFVPVHVMCVCHLISNFLLLWFFYANKL